MALHAPALLAVAGAEGLTSRQLADRMAVSQGHLSKILLLLTKARILESRRGAGGGFTLAQDADSIRLTDLYEAVEGPLGTGRETACGLGFAPTCPLADLMRDLNEQMRQRLESMTVADLAEALAPDRDDREAIRNGKVSVSRPGHAKLGARRHLRRPLSGVQEAG